PAAEVHIEAWRRSPLNEALIDQLRNLTTPHLADGCLRTNIPVRCAPAGLRPLVGNMRCAGRARPVRHVGSIDIFLEALQGAAAERSSSSTTRAGRAALGLQGACREEAKMTAAVIVSIRVSATPLRAFEAFTEEIGEWWRPSPLFALTPRGDG